MTQGYNKVTVKDFQAKLAEGGYDTIAGARRAVGRMSTWTDAQRDKARALADAHFGVDGEEPKKTTKKTSARRTSQPGTKQKVAKKRTKKASTKASAAPKKTTKGKRGTRGPRGPRAAADTASAEVAHSRLNEIHAKTEVVHSIFRGMENSRKFGVEESTIATDAAKAQRALSLIIDEILALSNVVVQDPSEGEAIAAQKFKTAAKVAAGPNGQLEEAPTPALPQTTPPVPTPIA